MNLSHFFLIALCTLGTTKAFAQSKQNQAKQFDAGLAVSGKIYRVIDFKNLPDSKAIDILANQGIDLHEYLGDKRYLVSIKSQESESLQNPLFNSVSKLELPNKVSEDIWMNRPCGIEDRLEQKLMIQHMPGLNDQKLHELSDQFGIQIFQYSASYRIFYAFVPKSRVLELAKEAWIFHLSCAPIPGQPEDREGRSMHRVNRITVNAKENLFLTGEGVKVCVRDDGFVGPHIDFKNRITNEVFGGNGTHGDMVSGILCGAGNIDPVIDGMAKGAELFVINYQDDFLDRTLDLHQINGVVITNSSYSNGCNAGYTAISQIVDKQIWENPSLLHVFSAGNSNNLDCGYGAGNQWGNITGGHKIGKNVLTCANLQVNAVIDGSSSRGPTRDGRLSPHISARGTNQLSTQDGNIYQVGGGTSAASPSVAGVATLLYDAYKKFNNGQNPPSALIKATIMNTGTDIGTPGPDYVFGYGVIDAYQAYKTIEQKRYQNLSIAQGETKEYKIQVPTGVSIAKFMIYWAERESSLGARKVLINDLDMELISPTGTVILPMVPNHSPNEITLAEGSKPGVDTLNNAEQVSINLPSAGEYTVRIKGKFLPDQNVNYFLLNHFDENPLTLTFPIGGEKLNSLEAIYIHYTSYLTDSVQVNFSTNGGNSWTNIKRLAGGLRLTNWTIPININSDSCMIEVVQGSQTVRSGLFTIASAVIGLRFTKYCPGELTLSWNRGIRDSFQIYTMGHKYMEPLTVVDTNTVTISVTPPLNDWWFAVAGYRDGVLSRRTKAINLPDTLVACPLQNDLAVKVRPSWSNRYFVVCGNETKVKPEIFVYNRNVNRVTGFKLKYLSGGEIVTEDWNQSINYRDSFLLTLKEGFKLDFNGSKEIPIWVELQTDENPYNDTTNIILEIDKINDENGVYPLTENFENRELPVNWISRNTIPVSPWNITNQIQASGQTGRVLSFTNSSFSYRSIPIELYSSTVDLSKSTEPYLYFDYAYHKYGGTLSFSDSFYIEILPVCENAISTKRIYHSGYFDIFTVDSSRNQSWVPTKASDWKKMTFDLSDYVGKKVIVNFGINRGVDGHFFLDNVNIDERLASTIKIDISRSPETSCIAKNSTFSATPDPRINLYRWDFGPNSTPRTANGAGPHNIRFSTIGPRIISLRLVSLTTDIIKTKEITVINTPSPSFQYNIEVDKLTVQFTNQSTFAQTVFWDFGDGNTSTQLNPRHTYATPAIYPVKLTVTNDCGTNSNNRNVDLLGTFVNDYETQVIQVLPNPFSDFVTINAHSEILGIKMIALDGKKVLNEINQNLTKSLEVNTANLMSGVYYIEVKTNHGIFYKKMIKL
ncbi:MAG: S8 family serine peptidase [Saprospiraceae bacterium]|nr:S8 family serine peptidase [Saprospiraceae bacterium]